MVVMIDGIMRIAFQFWFLHMSYALEVLKLDSICRGSNGLGCVS